MWDILIYWTSASEKTRSSKLGSITDDWSVKKGMIQCLVASLRFTHRSSLVHSSCKTPAPQAWTTSWSLYLHCPQSHCHAWCSWRNRKEKSFIWLMPSLIFIDHTGGLRGVPRVHWRSIMKALITLTLKIVFIFFSDWLLYHFRWYLRCDLICRLVK